MAVFLESVDDEQRQTLESFLFCLCVFVLNVRMENHPLNIFLFLGLYLWLFIEMFATNVIGKCCSF